MLSYALQLKLRCIAKSEFDHNYYNISNKEQLENVIKSDYQGLSTNELTEAWNTYNTELKTFQQNKLESM